MFELLKYAFEFTFSTGRSVRRAASQTRSAQTIVDQNSDQFTHEKHPVNIEEIVYNPFAETSLRISDTEYDDLAWMLADWLLANGVCGKVERSELQDHCNDFARWANVHPDRMDLTCTAFARALARGGITGKNINLSVTDPRYAALRATGKKSPKVKIYQLPRRSKDYVHEPVATSAVTKHALAA
ncbi:MAG: hypothetical protein JXQ99_16135 [Hyphomicrobiaceae bacterium]